MMKYSYIYRKKSFSLKKQNNNSKIGISLEILLRTISNLFKTNKHERDVLDIKSRKFAN